MLFRDDISTTCRELQSVELSFKLLTLEGFNQNKDSQSLGNHLAHSSINSTTKN